MIDETTKSVVSYFEGYRGGDGFINWQNIAVDLDITLYIEDRRVLVPNYFRRGDLTAILVQDDSRTKMGEFYRAHEFGHAFLDSNDISIDNQDDEEFIVNGASCLINDISHKYLPLTVLFDELFFSSFDGRLNAYIAIAYSVFNFKSPFENLEKFNRKRATKLVDEYTDNNLSKV